MVDLKILGKAMGFMFLPTLGVLTMLLVGFFDPVAMWTFIKSDNGWAVFTRLIVFLIEVGLVTGLYHYYKYEERIKGYFKTKDSIQRERIDKDTTVRYMFNNQGYHDDHKIYRTEDDNIVLVERIKGN